MLRIKRIIPDVKLPSYAHPDDAGLDLYAAEDKLIAPGEHCLVRSGIAVAIPKGFVGLLWDKSGIAAKGINVMGGVLDSNFRGEITFILKNVKDTAYEVKKNQKITQLLIQPINQFPIQEVTDLDATDRGQGRLGSTGLH